MENSDDMKKAAAATKESVGKVHAVGGMEKSTGIPESAGFSESGVKVDDFILDYVQLYTVLPGIPRWVTRSRFSLPMAFWDLHKYLGRAVEAYISYDTILRGNLVSLDGNLDLVLCNCYEDYYYYECQYYVGVVHLEGKHLKFIREID
ncbi:GL16607 [Drosophila persimilis]|uniref:GL16607 n=1 Tax=Drosophila persimilis TaxID=7234 RepID=B4GWS8_DROPE|nr:GL16607 [Drosophila persimilis]